SSRMRARAGLVGSKLVRMRPPSSGGMGIRLKDSKSALIQIEYMAITARGSVIIVCSERGGRLSSLDDQYCSMKGSKENKMVKSSALPIASTRFMQGPAAATSAMSRRG